MDSIDISDLAFSLGNMPLINEVLQSTTVTTPDIIPHFINETISETFVPETFVPETFVPETFVPETFVPDISDTDNAFFIYLGIGLLIIGIIGIFTYNFVANKNKHVRFQENVENYYQPPSNTQRTDF